MCPTTDLMRAEDSNRRKTSDAYIRHIAHDLRAPLNAMVGWAELVKAGQLSAEDTARAGATILRHARLLSQRLADALDVWRLDAGLLAISRRRASVAAAVRAAIDQVRPVADARQVECVVDIQSDGVVDLDVPRFVQATSLLVADAAANTAPGQQVETRVFAENGTVVVRVIGGGRLPDESAFARDPIDTAPRGGRAFDFGLPLAHALMALHGGSLHAEAEGSDRVALVARVPQFAEAAAQP